MMTYYKDPSPPKKTKGLMAKLKESLRKSDSKPKRKSDYVTHVPVKSDAESEHSFQRTQSDWSRASSQSIETRDRSGNFFTFSSKSSTLLLRDYLRWQRYRGWKRRRRSWWFEAGRFGRFKRESRAQIKWLYFTATVFGRDESNDSNISKVTNFVLTQWNAESNTNWW